MGFSSNYVQKWLGAVFAGLTLFSGLAAAQVLGNRGAELPLQILHSPNFDVVFPPHLLRVAQRSAAAAESIHAKVLNIVGTNPGRTTILLNDETDVFNGYALGSPQPFVRVYATFPRSGDIGTQWQDLMVALIGHEFTHVAHLSTHDDLRNFGRGIFGSVPGLTDARIPPAWFLEGLAVYVESEVTTGGRVRDAATRTLRAQMMRAKKWPSLTDISIGVLEKFPLGNARYAFGSGFVAFLMQRFSEAGVRKVMTTYNSSGWDFADAWQQATGESLEKLFADFTEQERLRSEVEEKALSSLKLPTGERLASGGSVAWRNDGALAYYGSGIVHVVFPNQKSDDANAQPTGWPSAIELASRPHRLSWDVAGNLVYSRFSAIEGQGTGDVYKLHPDGHEERLSNNARARDAVAFADCVLYVREEALQSSLRKLCAGTDSLVLAAPTDWHFMHPMPKPSSNDIALTVWRPGGFLDVAVLTGGALKFMTSDAAQDQWPTWLGNNLVFSSDRGGNFQLFYCDGENVSQLSASTGGTIAASVQGNAIAFASQTAEGSEVRIIRAETKEFASNQIPAPARSEPIVLDLSATYPVEEYAPDLTPRFWYPFSESGLGATIFGGDVAGIHQYRISAGYALINGLAFRNPTGFEAGMFYRFAPALSWNFDVMAHVGPDFWYAALAPRVLGGFELGADSVKFGFRPYAQVDATGLSAGASLSFDALSRDVFGYATSGWAWNSGINTTGRYSSNYHLFTDIVSLPISVGAGLGGANTNIGHLSQASVSVGTRFTVRPSWRLGDGSIGIERFTFEPFTFATFTYAWKGGASLWDVGGGVRLLADNFAFYLSPGNLGLEIAYGSSSGWSLNWILNFPLLGNLNTSPADFSPLNSSPIFFDPNNFLRGEP